MRQGRLEIRIYTNRAKSLCSMYTYSAELEDNLFIFTYLRGRELLGIDPCHFFPNNICYLWETTKHKIIKIIISIDISDSDNKTNDMNLPIL